MTCRHSAGDPNCSSSRFYPAFDSAQNQRVLDLQKEVDRQRELLKGPDNSRFEIVDVSEVPGHGIALKVKYDSCENCSYEGTKVLVYLGSTMRDVLKWRVIDPHFKDKPSGAKEAPSPDARFPASPVGWEMAKQMLFQQRDGGQRGSK